MNAPSKKILLAALLVSLVYFALFIYPNTLGARSETMLAKTSIDEPVIYPYVVRMLTPASGLKDLWERWVIYGDYHYGYPFYFLSALVVLPVRLAYGALFTNHTGLNLFLLRQLISVLPMLLACVLMVYLVTRFRSAWQTFGLLAVLLSVRGIVRNNLQWWHPDALSVLAVVLTIYFLERDRLRFGRDFVFAAMACGVAAGIKLAGAFFFLAVAGYLIAGLRQKRLTWKTLLAKGGLFIAVMLAALVISNPELYNSGARQELVNLQIYKSGELDQGYSDGSLYYAKGPQYWEWTLSRWFGNPWMLAFATLSILAGCLWGEKRRLNLLILGWIIPYSVYLFWFVAVKPDHYWLPVMVPLYSGLLNLPMILLNGPKPRWMSHTRLNLALSVLVFALAAGFVVNNFAREGSGIVTQVTAALNVERNLK
jgi:hypothetical protein